MGSCCTDSISNGITLNCIGYFQLQGQEIRKTTWGGVVVRLVFPRPSVSGHNRGPCQIQPSSGLLLPNTCKSVQPEGWRAVLTRWASLKHSCANVSPLSQQTRVHGYRPSHVRQVPSLPPFSLSTVKSFSDLAISSHSIPSLNDDCSLPWRLANINFRSKLSIKVEQAAGLHPDAQPPSP